MPETSWSGWSEGKGRFLAAPACGRQARNDECANLILGDDCFWGKRGLRRAWQLSVRFQNLLSKVIAHLGFVAGHRKVRRAQQLFLAVAQGIADRLLHLRLGQAAQSGSLAG